MIQYLFFLMLGPSQYGAFQAHQDSVFLYNTHQQTIFILENSTDVYALDEKLAKASEKALQRLSAYNNKEYEPVDERNKEGVGVAYAYPKPSALVPATQPEPSPAFKVLDPQTRFIVDGKGKTIRPYVVMNYYAKGRILLRTEKLDPVTHEVIQSEDAVATASN